MSNEKQKGYRILATTAIKKTQTSPSLLCVSSTIVLHFKPLNKIETGQRGVNDVLKQLAEWS